MNSKSDTGVIIYTTAACPDCRYLKMWLNSQGVAFIEKDLARPAIADEAKDRIDGRAVPVTIIGQRIFHGTFESQKPEIAEVLGLANASLAGAAVTTAVHIRQAQRTIEVTEGRTILEVALEQGIPYPHGCRSGRCGSCKSRLVDGEVDLLPHTPFALSGEERELGLILACRAQPKTDATVAWLGKDEETADHPVRDFAARVVALDDVTHDIRRLKLALKDGDHLAFSAGQYAQLAFPSAPPRDYSMANRPGERELEFHIRHVPGGAASERVAKDLSIGDEVRVRGPMGSSFLRERHTGPILAIAGGSGMAPIKSIVETALSHGLRQAIHVYFGVRQERDIYLLDHFRQLLQTHPNLRVASCWNRYRASRAMNVS